MGIARSRIEDNSHIYNIAFGSNREGLLVYQEFTVDNTVALARSDVYNTSNACGVIKQDFGTSVLVDFGGDVEVQAESSISIISGDTLYLSKTEVGKITNVAPDTTIMIIGVSTQTQVNGTIDVTLRIADEPIEL